VGLHDCGTLLNTFHVQSEPDILRMDEMYRQSSKTGRLKTVLGSIITTQRVCNDSCD